MTNLILFALQTRKPHYFEILLKILCELEKYLHFGDTEDEVGTISQDYVDLEEIKQRLEQLSKETPQAVLSYYQQR